MQFLYHENAGEHELRLLKQEYPHIFKVRRVKAETSLILRNMQDDTLYMYNIEAIEKKEAILTLQNEEKREIKASHSLTLGWCIIDPKIIEKMLPTLNEMGVDKIAFVYSDFSQHQFKLDIKRLKRIITNSSQQCGRSSLMKFEEYESVDEYLKNYPTSYITDFSQNTLENMKELPKEVLVGSEGGFSQRERELFQNKNVFGFKTPLILRSESAAIAICAKILL